MLESIIDLKNNKKKRVGADGSSTTLLFERLKKFISNLTRNRGFIAREPLNVGLQDIRDVPVKGKWWVVGAAWAGREDPSFSERTPLNTSNNELLKLAREHGMNTDVRRGIFVVLMSSAVFSLFILGLHGCL